jgi:hypothetical protein
MKPERALLAALAASCCLGCFSARAYIADKTQIELTDDISVCSQGVDDFQSCKPARSGGAEWVFNDNFDVFAATGGTYEQNLDQIRWRYLGTPYYRGSLHLECRANVPISAVPSLMLADDVDLASELQRTTVAEIAARAVFRLRAEGVDVSAEAEAVFKDRLREDVNAKVGARFFWFLTKWTGGKDSIARTPELRPCVDEVAYHNRNEAGSASFVTGVAGLMVLSNRVDTTVSSDSTILSALSGIIPTPYSPEVIEIQEEIAVEWRESIERKFTVRGSRRAVSQTVYPLWVQFE